MTTIRTETEDLGRHLQELAKNYPYLGVNLQIGEAAAYIDKAVEITPVGPTGVLRASWDPSIGRERSVSGSPGEVPTPAMARSRLRNLRPGQDAIVANAARAAGQRNAYAEIVWKRGTSDQLPKGGQRIVEEHLRQQFASIYRRAEKEMLDGL